MGNGVMRYVPHHLTTPYRMMSKIKIAPSILAADFARLESHAREAIAAGADGTDQNADEDCGHKCHNRKFDRYNQPGP